MQASHLQTTSIVGFIMLTIGVPVMLIVKFDFKKKISNAIVLAPMTAAWAVLLII